MQTEGFIELQGLRLEFKRWPGSKTPILLLHEALGSVSIWRCFPEELAQATGHEVVAWSRQGHGSSQRPPQPRSLDYLSREADLVPEVMNALGIEHAHLFGHSDGASIALITAVYWPQGVLSLVLEAPHVNVETQAVEKIAEARAAYQTTDLRQRLQRHHTDVDHVFYSWCDIWLSPDFHNWNIERLLSSIRAPTLLIQGEEDEYYSLDQLDRITRKVPSARQLILPDCRHSPHRDQKQTVLDATAKFLSEVEAAGHARKSAHPVSP